MPIGTLTDLASAMLDALESVFILYENEGEGDATPPAPAPETEPLLPACME